MDEQSSHQIEATLGCPGKIDLVDGNGAGIMPKRLGRLQALAPCATHNHGWARAEGGWSRGDGLTREIGRNCRGDRRGVEVGDRHPIEQC